MISLDLYLANPCKSLSLPYWKAKLNKTPENLLIIHNDDFSPILLDEYTDEKYFRLYHNLKNISNTANTDDYTIVTATENDIETIVSVINHSYTDLQVTYSQIESYTKVTVYNENFWILVNENRTGRCVGCGIADYDKEVKELILEWIQVLPNYRNKGIGQAIVNELLSRARSFAEFATVSGKIESLANPERLYRKCGFVGDDVWHIMRKK